MTGCLGLDSLLVVTMAEVVEREKEDERKSGVNDDVFDGVVAFTGLSNPAASLAVKDDGETIGPSKMTAGSRGPREFGRPNSSTTEIMLPAVSGRLSLSSYSEGGYKWCSSDLIDWQDMTDPVGVLT
jgi:hypothetical protein